MVQDGQRGDRTGEHHVQAGQAPLLGLHYLGGLDDHDVVVLQALGECRGDEVHALALDPVGSEHGMVHPVVLQRPREFRQTPVGDNDPDGPVPRLGLQNRCDGRVVHVLAADGAEGVLVSQTEVALASEARFAQTVATSGARRQRIETVVDHPGAGASVRLDGAYLLAEKRHADLTTVVRHQGVDGTTAQLAKGVVRDQARAVFQGRIVVAEGADRTDARMGHHALILSDRAEVDAKPELEIYADDVACAHGNTVGALDEDALFYIRSRGLPEPEARALLVEAFLGEVLDRIEHVQAHELARALYGKAFGGERIDSAEAVADVAASIGIDRNALLTAIEAPDVKDRVRVQNDAAMARGVFGSPYVIVDGEPFWGVDRFDQLDKWLETGGW